MQPYPPSPEAAATDADADADNDIVVGGSPPPRATGGRRGSGRWIEATVLAADGRAERAPPEPEERVRHSQSFEEWEAGRFATEGGSGYRAHLGRLCRGDLRAPLRIAHLWARSPVGTVCFELFPMLYRGEGPRDYVVGLVGFVRAPDIPPPRAVGAAATIAWVQARITLRRYLRGWCDRIELSIGYRVAWHERPAAIAFAPRPPSPRPLSPPQPQPPPPPPPHHHHSPRGPYRLQGIQAA